MLNSWEIEEELSSMIQASKRMLMLKKESRMLKIDFNGINII